MQPLAGEIRRQRFRRGSASMRRTCFSSTTGSLKLALRGEGDQLLVRRAAPQEIREPRGQFQIADAIVRPGRDAGGRALEAEHKFGTGDHRLQRRADAGLEIASVAARLIEAQQVFEIVVVTGRRYACRARRGDNLLGAGNFVGGRRGTAGEDLAAAGRLGNPG